MTFRHWLKGHEQDNTPIGNLARDVAQEPRYSPAQGACELVPLPHRPACL